MWITLYVFKCSFIIGNFPTLKAPGSGGFTFEFALERTIFFQLYHRHRTCLNSLPVFSPGLMHI